MIIINGKEEEKKRKKEEILASLLLHKAGGHSAHEVHLRILRVTKAGNSGGPQLRSAGIR